MHPSVLQLFLMAQQTAAPTAESRNLWAVLRDVSASAWGWSAQPSGRLILATLVGGFGIWLMLPGPSRFRKVLGAFLSAFSALMMCSLLPAIGLKFEAVMFWLLAAMTLSAGVATITSRTPVYCAIWFALVLLGTGGLFLINGAQFLGVATVAVYAGAIVVTFLFLLMLAQPEGHSFYDRISWGNIPSLLGCFAGVAVAALLIDAISQTPLGELATASGRDDILADEHVAAMGGQLFTRHLLGVQLAGTLLLAALVGAVAMAAHGAQRHHGLGAATADHRSNGAPLKREPAG